MSFLAERLKIMEFNKLTSVGKDRCQIIISVSGGLITAKQAAGMLSVSERHIRRLIKKYRDAKTIISVIPRRRTDTPWNKSEKEIEQEVVRLKKRKSIALKYPLS